MYKCRPIVKIGVKSKIIGRREDRKIGYKKFPGLYKKLKL